jgi:hypothetical protein
MGIDGLIAAVEPGAPTGAAALVARLRDVLGREEIHVRDDVAALALTVL